MQIEFGFATDVGRKRMQNQDHGTAIPDLGLFIVADGMGGHRGGETASAISVETISAEIASLTERNWDPKSTLIHAIQTANRAIFEKSETDPHLQGMGTTTTALLFKDQTLTIGHVGDSRCYLLRPHQIWQVTRDHSLVQEKLDAGLITRDEIKTDQMKNVITRSVGFEQELEVEIYQLEPQAGDCFLICSDGLSGLVEDSRILKVVQRHAFEDKNLQGAVLELIAAANANGGDDNITSILVQIV